MSSGRRRTRSVSTPVSGPRQVPQMNAKNTSPAALLLPVSSLTQMPMASHSALSPSVDRDCPAR